MRLRPLPVGQERHHSRGGTLFRTDRVISMPVGRLLASTVDGSKMRRILNKWTRTGTDSASKTMVKRWKDKQLNINRHKILKSHFRKIRLPPKKPRSDITKPVTVTKFNKLSHSITLFYNNLITLSVIYLDYHFSGEYNNEDVIRNRQTLPLLKIP